MRPLALAARHTEPQAGMTSYRAAVGSAVWAQSAGTDPGYMYVTHVQLFTTHVYLHEFTDSQNFRFFHESNLSALNFLIFPLMYPDSMYAPVASEAPREAVRRPSSGVGRNCPGASPVVTFPGDGLSGSRPQAY